MLANKYNLLFFEVSAKTGEGISEMFNELAKQIVEVRSPVTETSRLDLDKSIARK